MAERALGPYRLVISLEQKGGLVCLKIIAVPLNNKQMEIVMTSMVMDVRELTFDEVGYVSGGFNFGAAVSAFVSTIAGAVAGAATLAVTRNPSAAIAATAVVTGIVAGIEPGDIKVQPAPGPAVFGY